MPKQKVFLLVGLPHSGVATLRLALERHRETLSAQRIQQPAESEDEMFRAAVWIRRDHRAWSLRRRDLDGAWIQIWRRAWATKDTVVLGHDLLAGMSNDEIALLVDRFPGFAVHVVVLAGAPDPRVALFPDDLDLAAVVGRWSGAVKSPDRLHLIAIDAGDTGPAWAALGEVIGFEADALALPDPRDVPVRADAATLRLLAESSGAPASRAELTELADSWAKLVADGGYDVHGDLAGLAARIPVVSSDPGAADERERVAILSDALAESVAELVRLRDHVGDLEQERAKSERKRRKLKKRLREN